MREQEKERLDPERLVWFPCSQIQPSGRKHGQGGILGIIEMFVNYLFAFRIPDQLFAS
jgi:hypothetical protein